MLLQKDFIIFVLFSCLVCVERRTAKNIRGFLLLGLRTVLARTRGNSRVLTSRRTPKRRRRRHSTLCVERRTAKNLRGFLLLGLRTVLARTRGNSRVLTSRRTPKKTADKRWSFLAQKTRFELVLRFSHTTPLAGEPLEPLGYFCMAQFFFLLFKSYITITHFFTLVKAFCPENKKIFANFPQTLDRAIFIVYNKKV